MNKAFFEKFINYYYCDRTVLKTIEASEKLTDAEKILFLKYLDLKNQNHKISCSHIVNPISLGCNCYPHTTSIRLGYKYPKWISGKDRLFHDLAVTNIRSTNLIFQTDADAIPLADDYGKTQTYFISKQLNFQYNHDFVDSEKEKEQSISEFLPVLKKRLNRTKKELKSGNCLCLCTIYKTAARVEDINLLEKNIKQYNKTNCLIIIDPENLIQNHGDISKGVEYINLAYPNIGDRPFIWYEFESYFTNEGFNYFEEISNKLNTIINERFPKSTDSDFDVFSECGKSDEYSRLINSLK